jgi:uncharacterized protein (TIGR00730 family)
MTLKSLFPKIFKPKETIQYQNHIDSDVLTRKKMANFVSEREKVVQKEFDAGYRLIEKYPRSVSVLGSARFKRDNKYYDHAESLTRRIVKELKYAVVTGGGPGIMEAANKGAYEAGGVSIGFGIKLPKEQKMNPYVTESVEFEYFFSRKTLLFFNAECYIYYPGGFGTLDELFEIVTLIQTKKMEKVPVVLVGKDFWGPILYTLRRNLLEANHTISYEDTNIYKIVDSEDEIIEIIKNSPFRDLN